MEKQSLFDYIEQHQEIFTHVSDRIWELAELSLQEFESAALYEKVLKEEGFTVESGLCNVKTAFSGSYGSGRPIIGILAEFDALSGLSQKGGAESREVLKEGASGHGCGHNLLGAGSLAAAFAIKHYLQETKTPGTVIFYGCPGEEGGSGKTFMAREGLWKNLDAALTWHPGSANAIVSGTCNSSIEVEFRYHGIASHAAGDPQAGRSALDGVELLNVGVQFLREHMKDSDRIHYSITDAGGISPNVVQSDARVLYMVRSTQVRQCIELLKRVIQIAKGAAMMTETTVDYRYIDGTANTVANHTLEEILYKNFELLGVDSYSEEEWAFASALKQTFPNQPEEILAGIKEMVDAKDYKQVSELSDHGKKALFDFLVPYKASDKQSMGSTDVGDVSWLTPTAQFETVCFAGGSPGHSWQNVSCGKTSIAHKGLLTAGKVLAAAAVDLFENPDLLVKAKEEFKENAKDGYLCPIPDGVPPTTVDDPFVPAPESLNQ